MRWTLTLRILLMLMFGDNAITSCRVNSRFLQMRGDGVEAMVCVRGEMWEQGNLKCGLIV